jgi:hypothetical protein
MTVQRTRASWFVHVVLVSAQVILLLTAAAKLVTLLLGGGILQASDPLLGIPTGWVLGGAAAVELGAAVAAWRLRDKQTSCLLITMLGGQFVAYRAALAMGGFSRGCPCLGRLGEWLPISAQALDRLLWFAAFWLLLGGAMSLWAASRRTPARALGQAGPAAGLSRAGTGLASTTEVQPAEEQA